MNILTQDKLPEKFADPKCLKDSHASEDNEPHLGNSNSGAFKIKNILVAADTLGAADHALGYARMFAEHFGSKITFVYAPASGGCGMEDLKARIFDKIDIQPSQLNEIIVHPRGASFLGICNAARARVTDLIVISAQLRLGTHHLFHQSVVDKIVRQAHCPVLVVETAKAIPLADEE